jgi:NAD(P)-dependent dehydrogenase (short-subunit alcohol dehydrogenase family)
VGAARRPAAIDDPRYRHLLLDLADGAALETLDAAVGDTLASRVWDRVGLVNNAALGGQLGPVERIDSGEFQRMTTVNVVVPVHLMGTFVARTPPDATLRIVNVSSGAAVRAFPGLGAYGATKAALRMAGMILAAELDSPPQHESAEGRGDRELRAWSCRHADAGADAFGFFRDVSVGRPLSRLCRARSPRATDGAGV